MENDWQNFLDSLNPEDRISLSKIKKFEDFRTWYEAKNFEQNIYSLWQAKQDFVLGQGASAPINQTPDDKERSQEQTERHRQIRYHSIAQELKEEAREDARALERPSPPKIAPPRVSPTRIVGRGLVNRANSALSSGRAGFQAGSFLVRSLAQMLGRALIAATSAAIGLVLTIPGLIIAFIVIIIIVVIVMIGFLFPINPGNVIVQSPYPGISYSIVAQPEEPQKASIGQNIFYRIYFLYFKDRAEKPSESLTLVSSFPSQVEIVRASGEHEQGSGFVKWPLSNNSFEESVTTRVYSFELVLRSNVDLTLKNELTVDGL